MPQGWVFRVVWFPMIWVAQRHMASRSIMPVSLALVCAIMAIVAFTLWQAREDARTRAQREGENIVHAIEADVARNIEVYDLSLQGLREALATVAVAHVEQEVQRLALFDRAASAKYMGALLVLNATGDIVISSRSTTPTPINLADRDYFQVHQSRPDIGLYISRPFKGRLEHREDNIALSRRLADEDGKFCGRCGRLAAAFLLPRSVFSPECWPARSVRARKVRRNDSDAAPVDRRCLRHRRQFQGHADF
jgi:hypothetical protein